MQLFTELALPENIANLQIQAQLSQRPCDAPCHWKFC